MVVPGYQLPALCSGTNQATGTVLVLVLVPAPVVLGVVLRGTVVVL
jgi:hypothetical protein